MRRASQADLPLPPSKRVKKHNNNDDDEQLQFSLELTVTQKVRLTLTEKKPQPEVEYKEAFVDKLWGLYAKLRPPSYESNWKRIWDYCGGLGVYEPHEDHLLLSPLDKRAGELDRATWLFLLTYVRSLEC